MITLTHSTEETASLASFFVSKLSSRAPAPHATVVCMFGDLGSGKTTFVKGVAEALHVRESVTSPTFVLEKIYALDHPQFKNLIHIDAYRLEKGEEIVRLGWNEIIKDPHNLIIVEWPSNIKDVLPPDYISIECNFVDPTTRGIDIKM